MPKQHGSRGEGKKVESHDAIPLSDLGIKKDESSRCQAIAEWGADGWVEVETIRATIDAAEKGLITLPEVGERGPRRKTSQSPVKFSYSKGTVAQFLGWTRKANGSSLQPDNKCEVAFAAIYRVAPGRYSDAVNPASRARAGHS